MAKHRHERLCAWIDASALATKDDAFPGLNLFLGRKLVKNALVDHEVETGIAAVDRMADSVSLASIEEKHLVCFRNGIALTDMALEDAAIRINEACPVGAFLAALVPAFTIADDIADEDGFRLQQQGCRNL
jgi:hypothetical protein